MFSLQIWRILANGRRWVSFLAGVGAVLAAGSRAGATTLSDNLTAPTTYTELINDSSWIAASFGTGSSAYTLSDVTALIQSDSGIPILALYSNSSAGAPGALLGKLGSPTTFFASLTPTVFSGDSLQLSADNTYWLVMSPVSGTSEWAYTPSNSGTGIGFQTNWGQSTDGGASWLTATSQPMQMKVDAVAASSVPEPSSEILLLLGSALIAAPFVRRRQAAVVLAFGAIVLQANAQCPSNTQAKSQPACPKVRAMVNGPVNSLIYNELAKNLDVSDAPPAGLLGASDYDVLIFDGKQLLHRRDVESLKKNIKDALNGNRWVLGILR